MFNKKIPFFLVISIIIATFLITLIGILVLTKDADREISYNFPNNELLGSTDLKDIKKFSSEEEFNNYLDKAIDMVENYYDSTFLGGEIGSRTLTVMPSTSEALSKTAPERYSGTNVQTLGIDELDIVKTDGNNIYISSENPYYLYRSDYDSREKTKIVQAFPLDNLSLISEIDKSGKLLLKEGILVVFSFDRILGYDVSDPKNPNLKWEIKINEKTQIVDARMYQEKIYLVINNAVYRNNPCVIEPLIINNNPFKLSCTNIYYPGEIIPTDAVYTLLKIDLLSGEKEKEISFVGSRTNSIVYMSSDNFYLSYFQSVSPSTFTINFFKEKMADNFPDVVQKLKKLEGYDISPWAKEVEAGIILDEFFNSLDSDEQIKLENEMVNKMIDYYNENKRNLESTGIVKIELSDLEIKSSGIVPGRLLNQFAIDEYNNHLRIATTIGEGVRGFIGTIGMESFNDIYVLDENLNKKGSVEDLGLGERIYSVRFLGDKGYLVTFREIDPFYILNLSDPSNPQMTGELKIPGYSSYLHSIKEGNILGIGKEDRFVKISLFDVKNPYEPKEIDKYFLNDYWSEILNNHHAFLLDNKYEIFFIPGSQGGYIFSFKNEKIELVKAIKQNQVRRALYIDDYLYIISAENIIVLDQNNWETVKEINI